MPLRRTDHQSVEESLQATGLSDLRDREINQLSGGEWRRVILARALAQQTRVMLLDEPTAGLDLKYQVHFLNLMKRMIAARRFAIALTMHDINLASAYADRIALMRDGEVVAVDSPQAVINVPLLEEVFGIELTVLEHPVYKTPFVVPMTNV